MSLLDRLRAVGSRRGSRPSAPPGPWVILAAWGPCGFSPVAPGTVGTLGAVPLWWALSHLPAPAHLAAIVILTLFGVTAASHAGRYWGVTDASAIVIDEVVGYLVTVALVPFSWQTAALGFVLFRVFDVAKPWPASVLDRVKNPWGVMFDDVAAGLYAMALLAVAVRWLPEVF
ncbi:MAG: phosphatidylglycerophosphatase A [Anaeromyxobacteraceae bacterium]